MALALITPPAANPLTLAAVKAHLRVETGDDDAYLTDLMATATGHLEAVSGLKLITQTWRQYLDCLPIDGQLQLAVAPVQAISAMRVYDAAGTEHIIAPAMLDLDAVSAPARLHVSSLVDPHHGYNGVEIDILAGFGDSGTDIPDSLKRALLLFIAHNYEFRGALPKGEKAATEPHGFRTLIAPFRRVRL